MNLLEFEGKDIFRRYGISVPESRTARDPAQALAAAVAFGGPCMIKAQVPAGGRGKAGLVRSVEEGASAGQVAAEILGSAAAAVDLLLVERRLSIRGELYLAIRVDDVRGVPVILAGAHGGVEVESHAADVFSLEVDMLAGLANHQAIALWKRAGVRGQLLLQAVAVTTVLWRIFVECDAELVEINPLAIDGEGKLWAADAKVVINDNALSRHPQYANRSATLPGSATEVRARELGVNTYMDLGPGVALVSSGASFSMHLLDQVQLAGGRAANFMDMGGRATPLDRERMMRLVIEKVANDPGITAVLFAFVQSSRPLRVTLDAVRKALAGQVLHCPVYAFICASYVATEQMSVKAAYEELETMGVSTFERLEDAVRAAVGGTAR